MSRTNKLGRKMSKVVENDRRFRKILSVQNYYRFVRCLLGTPSHRPKGKQVHTINARWNFHTVDVRDHIILLKGL